MRFDKHGVLLADVPNAGVARRDPNARSGNPSHDVRSGKFAPGGGRRRTTPPANVDAAAYARMRDAVREAARQYKGNLTPENLQAFINQRATNPAAVNLQAFAQAVAQQQLDDIVDVLDARNHGGLKVTAPRSYIGQVLAGISDDDVAEIIQRLQARGIKDAHIVVGRALPKERRDVAQPIEASEQFEWIEESEPESSPEMNPVELADIIAKALPTPQVTVEAPQITVEVPPQRMRNTPVRDEKSGLILYTIQEPMDAS